jgi:hypothetical protein
VSRINRFPHRYPLLAVLVVWVAAVNAQAPQSQPGELAAILGGLAARTRQYYDRFISIICTETAHQQDLKSNLAPTGKPRVTVYELSVTRDPDSKNDSDFRVERTLLSVNGRPARKNQTPGCTDPKTGTPEPLAFLLAENQARFRFSLNAAATGGPAGTRAIDFIQTPPDRVKVKWVGNCFDAEGGGQVGRVWFDPQTFDVLQVDARLSQPFAVPVPSGIFGAQPAIRVERSEVTMRFARVKFEKPDEVVLLPESIDTLTVFRGVPSLRTSQKLSNFRRFLSELIIRPVAF